ncbi:MAG: ABC transporter ATP-binding protein [Spirochaetales bacterium]|nr:ABC transporter ATP-binding protein [Spirochaetales bacterium]
MTTPVLETVGLVHTFDDGRRGLDHVSISFLPGTFNILAGANGSGKTLFLRHLVGLTVPTEGTILLNGAPANKNWNLARQQMGFLFQDADAQILEATVLEDALFGPRHQGIPHEKAEKIAKESLALCGLDHREEDLTSLLSGGEKRRLNLAGVLTLGASILLLDEPFNGLDQPGVEAFLRILIDLQRQGRTIVLVTHDLEKCLAHSSSLTLWHEGRILATGSPDQVWDEIPRAGVHRPCVGRENWKELTWLPR